MPEILDLGMYDEEYLQLLNQGRNPIHEKFYQRQLIRTGVSPEDAHYIVSLLISQDLSNDEQAIIRGFWQLVMG